LNVIARTSAMRYQESQKTTREIAQELHVDAVVEGAAQRSGDRVLITAQLIEASSDRHLWARSYERNLRDTLALQNEVAQAITRELQVKLTPQEQIRLANPHPVNPEAQEAYFRGVYWNQKGTIGFSRGFDYFQQAVTKDPNYAAAYAALSGIYDPLIRTGVLPAREAQPKWRAAVTKALELDPTLADAYLSRGGLLAELDWNWQDAERDVQRALELNPNLALAHFGYAYYLASVGRPDEAVTEARRAVQLDPFSVNTNAALGRTLVFAGRQDEALQQGRRMLEVNTLTAHRIMGLAYEQMGNFDLAIGEFQQRMKGIDQYYPLFPDSIAELAHAYAAAGMRSEALRLLSELQRRSKRRFVPSWTFALIYAGLGDKDQAFRWLDKGFDERPSDMSLLKVDPRWATLRSDPRYPDLLRRMDLPP